MMAYYSDKAYNISVSDLDILGIILSAKINEIHFQ